MKVAEDLEVKDVHHQIWRVLSRYEEVVEPLVLLLVDVLRVQDGVELGQDGVELGGAHARVPPL